MMSPACYQVLIPTRCYTLPGDVSCLLPGVLRVGFSDDSAGTQRVRHSLSVALVGNDHEMTTK